MEGRKILVTGAGGYIGSVLTAALLERGYAVRAVDRYFFGVEVLDEVRQHPALEVVKKDVRDLAPADLEGIYGVLDLAAFSNDPSGDLDPDLTDAINHRARARAAALAKEAGVERYVLASSCSVYGTGAMRGLTEESPTQPLTVYAASNLRAEEATLALAGPGFTTSAIRNATVFGLSRRMRFDLIINIMTLHAYERNRIMVLGGGKQWRPLVHVRDVAGAFIAVLEAPAEAVSGRVFNNGKVNHQVRTVAAIVREVLPFPVEITITPDDPDKRDYSVSFDKIRAVVGYEPQVTVEEGIREVYDALKYGLIEPGPRTSTVRWYRGILEAKRLVEAVELDGRLL